MRKKSSEQGIQPIPLADAVQQAGTDRMVDGVPVRTYRGASLAELAPRIRAELGDSAMILRQREGVTGGIAGFFAKRMVEIDVAVLQVPGGPQGRIDTTDGPSVGPGGGPVAAFSSSTQPESAPVAVPLPPPAAAPSATIPPAPEPMAPAPPAPAPAVSSSPQATVSFDALRPPLPPTVATGDFPPQPTVPFSTIAEQHGLPAAHAAFTVGAPSAAEAAGVEAALLADQARQRAERADAAPPPIYQTPLDPATPIQAFEAPPATPIQAAPVPPAPTPAAEAPVPEPEPAADVPEALIDPSFDSPFDPGRAGAEAASVAQSSDSFEAKVRSAGLTDAAASTSTDPVARLAPLHTALLHRGLPDQIASPVADDTLCHRIPLQPDRDPRDLLVSELARRIPTAPLAGRAGQAVAFVGSSGAGKTRAIARLAAAYGASGRVPVACVTLQESGSDGLLATALAPFGIAVHTAPDAPRALDRITALRRHALVLVDTPGVSPGDRTAVERLGATLELLELDQVALCLPVVLAAPIARRVLRAMRPLGPTMLVATHADEADLLGGVVAVAIDRRVPLAYVSAGAGRGTIAGADAHEIAAAMIGPAAPLPADPRPSRPSASSRATKPIERAAPTPEPAPTPVGPAVDVAAGAGHIAAPWIVSTPLRAPGRRR